LQPALAGLLVGVIGLGLPQVMGAGYDFIDQAMHDEFTWKMLLLLALFKIIASSACFVSGTPGGMFAPTLFIGAMIGAAVGTIEHHFFPWLTGSVGAYALVGMGTLFAGFLRVPMTSVFMVLEVSGNYSIIVPVMVSNTIAYLICRQYQPTSLFDILSRQDGMDLPSMEENREEVTLHVEDTMRAYQGEVLDVDKPIGEALKQAEASEEVFVLAEDSNGKWYGISKEELRRQAGQMQEGATLRSVLSPEPLPYLHPDHNLDEALRRLSNWPLLPVVNRADFRKMEGVVGIADITAAYHAASTA
jgi:chloride channel protein, CIC family